MRRGQENSERPETITPPPLSSYGSPPSLVGYNPPLAPLPPAPVQVGSGTARRIKSWWELLVGWLWRNEHHSPPEPFPFPRDFRRYRAVVPLRNEFRFAHEPVDKASSARFVGRHDELGTLVERILFSEGGSFLITGYRGVGKTSFVNRVIQKLDESLAWSQPLIGDVEVLDIHINIARPMSPAELMHHIIRRIYEHLSIRGTLSQLDGELYEAIELAYRRTSLNMTRKLAESTEHSLGINELSFGTDLLKATIKGSGSRKQSRTQNAEMSYLGYDDRAAEDDLTWISRRLAKGYRKNGKLKKLKIIFVFDELDKLEDTIGKDGEKISPLDELLHSLKNLFTTSGIIFVFVAGKDLQERWADDLRRGDSVYESVFSHDTYLPCMWTDADALCSGFVDWEEMSPRGNAWPPFCPNCGRPNAPNGPRCLGCNQPFSQSYPSIPGPGLSATCGHFAQIGTGKPFCPECGAYVLDASLASSAFTDFKDYLSFKGRGIPRRIIRAFNEYVVWESRSPCLAFAPQDLRRIRFYAGLQRAITSNSETIFSDVSEEVIHTQKDRQKLGVYYLMDWILRQGNSEFTQRDAVIASKALSAKIAPAEELAPRLVGNLFAVLVQEEYLEEVKKGLDQAQIGDAEARSEQLYRLSPRRMAEMDGLAGAFEEEAHALGSVSAPLSRLGPYELHEQIGSGGMGSVYRAWDAANQRWVAVKRLSSSLALIPEAVERFKREAALLGDLTHPNLIQYYGSGEDGGELYIAMELIDGMALDQVLRNYGALPVDAAVTTARQIARAVAYVHNRQIARLDLKPANVLLRTDGRLYLTDFGTVRPSNDSQALTEVGSLVGTPLYMAPEQFSSGPVDARTDIYSFGAVVYEMLTGQLAAGGTELFEIVRNQLEGNIEPPSRFVDVPPALEGIVMKCLAREPDQRYQVMTDVLEALERLDVPDVPSQLSEIVKAAEAASQREVQTVSSRTVISSLGDTAGPPTAYGDPYASAGAAYGDTIHGPTPGPYESAGRGASNGSAASVPGSPTPSYTPVPVAPPVYADPSAPPPVQPSSFPAYGAPPPSAPYNDSGAPRPQPPSPPSYDPIYGAPLPPHGVSEAPASPPTQPSYAPESVAPPQPASSPADASTPQPPLPSTPLTPEAWDQSKSHFAGEEVVVGSAYPPVDRTAVQEASWLEEGDTGTHEPHLVIFRPDGSQTIGRLSRTASNRIGRGAESDIQVTDLASSRYHSEIYSSADEWYVRDLNSANGTYVNGQRVLTGVKLSDGDVIRIGQQEMRFVAPG
jgi:serine/threonine-protein kinase